MRIQFLAFFLILVCSSVAQQAKLTVDRTHIVIGDHVQVEVAAPIPSQAEWTNVKSIFPDSVSTMALVNEPQLKTSPGISVVSFSIACFDTGWIRIPPLPVVFSQAGQLDTFFTNDVPIYVNAVEPDSTGLNPIKPIVEEPFRIGYYKKYIPYLAILLLIGGYMYYAWKNRKKTDLPRREQQVVQLPHEWALAALDDLEAQRLWQQGEIKEHYTQLTTIFRTYLEKRFHIHAQEQTSDEILSQLQHRIKDQQLFQETSELLSISDLIKFAKADPGVDVHARAIAKVKTFVRQLAQVDNGISSSSSAKSEGDGVG